MSEPSLYSKDQVFTYLEQNEEVAREYFTLRAKSQWVDEWLYKRSHRPSLQQHTGNIQAVLTAQTNTATNTSSPSNLLLKPLKTGRTIEGHKKLQQIFNRDECASKEQDKSDVASRAELASKLSEMDLFMALIRDVSEELDVNSLSHKILVNVSLLTNGDRCSLFLLKGSHEKQYLVSRLFDVTIDSTLESSLKPEGKEIIVPVGVGVAGTSAQTGETININNAYEVILYEGYIYQIIIFVNCTPSQKLG